jgi:hypothetical protein
MGGASNMGGASIMGRSLPQSAVNHGSDGVKHLMLVMFQIVLFKKSLWLLL